MDTHIGTATGQARAVGRVTPAVRDLHPGYFAFVMATGIVSTGLFVLGPTWLSKVLLAATVAGLVVLTVALAARIVFFRSAVAADLRAPQRVFGFFTITAGLNVLGVRLAAGGHPLIAAILAAVSAVVWLLLTYGVPAILLLTRAQDSSLPINGSWLMWVVATQSVSLIAAVLVPAFPSQRELLAATAAGLWSVGLGLYVLLVSLILLRLTVPKAPANLGPAYWILMGATAITVLAGVRILELSKAIPLVHSTAGFIQGSCFALWAFGTWWIPLLMVVGLWQHYSHHGHLSYEPSFWSAVFPLGMYSVATLLYGRATHIAFMEPIARVMLWISVAAWVLVAGSFLIRLTGRPPARASQAAGASDDE
jgi:tellurite resistance protein TehA-like permease